MKILYITLLSAIFIFSPFFNSSVIGQETQQKLSKKEIRMQNKLKEEAKIDSLINSSSFSIVVDRIIPMQGRAIFSSSGYNVRLSNDSLFCYLPYFGNSRTPIYGGQRLTLESSGQLVKPIKQFDAKSESTIFQFTFINDNLKDRWTCTMQIFTNGNVNIRMDGNSRDSISYQGTVNLKPKNFKN